MSSAQIHSLQPDQVKAFSAEQLAHLSSAAIGGLSLDQLHQLSNAQLHSFTQAQLLATDYNGNVLNNDVYNVLHSVVSGMQQQISALAGASAATTALVESQFAQPSSLVKPIISA